MDFFEPSVIRTLMPPTPNHNFVVFAPMIMKFGTDMKLDVLYKMAIKSCDVTNIT